jgi:hypothetical protein
MKRSKPASANTFTIMRGGSVLGAKTTSPLANQSLLYDGPLLGCNLNDRLFARSFIAQLIVKLWDKRTFLVCFDILSSRAFEKQVRASNEANGR